LKFSPEAHLWATGGGDGHCGPPFDKLFPEHQPDRLLDYFARVIGILRAEAVNPEALLPMTLRKKPGGVIQIRINI
jgi:hypothetical protein